MNLVFRPRKMNLCAAEILPLFSLCSLVQILQHQTTSRSPEPTFCIWKLDPLLFANARSHQLACTWLNHQMLSDGRLCKSRPESSIVNTRINYILKFCCFRQCNLVELFCTSTKIGLPSDIAISRAAWTAL